MWVPKAINDMQFLCLLAI